MRVAIIGAGKMGRAITESLAKSRIGRIMATRRNVEAIRDLEELGIDVTSDNRAAASWADLVVLCVKPGDVAGALTEIRDATRGKIIISIAAAVSLRYLRKLAPESRFIRAMPNIGVLVQESFTAYAPDEGVSYEDERAAIRVFDAMGKYAKVDEVYLNAITALSGCIPAYTSLIVESFVDGGIKVGLDGEIALNSVAQAIFGTAKLLLETKRQPAELRDMVATPGGVSIEGLRVMEKEGIPSTLTEVIQAGTEKCNRISRDLEAQQETG